MLGSRYFGTHGLGVNWIPTVLRSPHTFLSLLYMTSVHHDTICGRAVESVATLALRQDVIHMIDRNIRHPDKSIDDYNVIAVLQLIMGELIGRAEQALHYHEVGLEKMIQQRGGLVRLGLDGRIASVVSWTAVVSKIFQEIPCPTMYNDYCASKSSRKYAPTTTIPESPLYCPHGTYITLQRSRECREEALDTLCDIRMMIDFFLHNVSFELHVLSCISLANTNKLETTMSGSNIYHTISLYERIIMRPGVAVLRNSQLITHNDWRYEAIRIASTIQATAIVKRLPLSDALCELFSPNIETGVLLSTPSVYMAFDSGERSVLMDDEEGISVTSSFAHITSTTDYSDNRSTTGSLCSEITSATSCCQADSHSDWSPATHRASQHHVGQPLGTETRSFDPNHHPPRSSESILDMSVALLRSLKNALEHTNLSECWSDMTGVLLWIGLVAGAASRNIEDVPLKRYFSATAMRAAFRLCFEHPEAIHATVLRMHAIIEGLSRLTFTIEDGTNSHPE
jgi:hypothetical protein